MMNFIDYEMKGIILERNEAFDTEQANQRKISVSFATCL
jgi:hypothetical protein